MPIRARPPYDARPPPNPDAPPPWTKTGSLLAPEPSPQQLGFPLPFGRVLLWKKEPELYDANTGVWRKTSARPACADPPVAWERLARIPDEIVFAIGAKCGYDAEHDAWVPVPHFDVHGPGFAVTQLAKGHVLVTGGGEALAPRKEAFRWDSDTKEVAPLTLGEARTMHDAIRLLDDTVLITATSAGAKMELFVPSAGAFRSLGPQEYDGESALLEDGRVLFLAKGKCGLYDPSNASWLACPPMNVPRVPHTFTITAIRGDRALVTGGRAESDVGQALDLAEIYDPHDDVWLDVLAMPIARAGHVAVPLLDGRVVIVAGVTGVASVEGADGAAGGAAVGEAFLYTPELPPKPPPLPPSADAD